MKKNRRSPGTANLILALCRLAWRKPGTTLLILLALGGYYGYDSQFARHDSVFAGVPRISQLSQVTHWFRVLHNHGFMLGYSDIRGNPLWVAYTLHPVPANAPNLKRPSHFSPDWRGFNRVDHQSYNRSGYDRGHLAPNYAMSRLYGAQAQADSFLMTNITPQKPHLNQKWWQRLESVEIDFFAKQFGTVWVMTGPVFDNNIERLKSAWAVEIPDAFYKIYIAQPTPGQTIALAFLVPQTVAGNEALDKYLTSIDAIEQKTGLDFFHKLNDTEENRLEAAIDPAPWQLQSVAQTPSRY